MSKNLSGLSGRKGMDENLYEKLGDLAEQNDGTPDPKELKKLAEKYLMGNANTYGATSFYDFLKPANKGKKVYYCNGSSCLTAKTQEGVVSTLKNNFKEEEVGHICCLGRCHENSAFHYDGKNYSGDAIDNIKEIVKDKPIQEDEYHVEAFGEAILTSEFGGIENFKGVLTDMFEKSDNDALDEIKKSGMRGRGGAGFPIGFKLESCKNTPSDERFIVCNADEGDPGAYSDKYIMEQQPLKLLLGMMIAGYVVGAQWGVLYIRYEYPDSLSIINEAIAELEKEGLIGENILGSGFDFYFKTIKARGAYICGEETSLLSSIEGQRAEVRVRPPYPTQKGLFSKPTVVNNVESLANLPFILEQGGDAYSAIGHGRSTGTKLISLDGFFNRPGIYEVPMGYAFEDVVNECGQGLNTEIKAMHIGGPLGGLVPKEKWFNLTIDFESFAENGFLLGHASVVCIPNDFPLPEYVKHLFKFTSDESCGKCFPCRLGSKRGEEMFEQALKGDYKIDRELLDDLLETLESGSLCALGGGLPLPIKNALQYFVEEFNPYFEELVVSN